MSRPPTHPPTPNTAACPPARAAWSSRASPPAPRNEVVLHERAQTQHVEHGRRHRVVDGRRGRVEGLVREEEQAAAQRVLEAREQHVRACHLRLHDRPRQHRPVVHDRRPRARQGRAPPARSPAPGSPTRGEPSPPLVRTSAGRPPAGRPSTSEPRLPDDSLVWLLRVPAHALRGHRLLMFSARLSRSTASMWRLILRLCAGEEEEPAPPRRPPRSASPRRAPPPPRSRAPRAGGTSCRGPSPRAPRTRPWLG